MAEVYELDSWLEGYLSFMSEVRRRSPGTVRDVRCTLRCVSRYMDAEHPEQPLWRQPLQSFLGWIEHERLQGRSSRSLAKQISHLRGLLDYAWRSGKSDRNVLDGFQLHGGAGTREVPDFLNVEEARRLVEACPSGTKAERAERVMVLLLYGCGLRSSELCDLKVQHVDHDRHELFVERGKGGRQRHVPVPDGVFGELLAYLYERGGKRGPLFRTAVKDSRISVKYLCDVVSAAGRRANLDRHVTPKMLRHSYATHLMDRGVDLAVISQLMGHRSPTESGVYLHVLEGRPRQAVAQLPGAAGQGDQ